MSVINFCLNYSTVLKKSLKSRSLRKNSLKFAWTFGEFLALGLRNSPFPPFTPLGNLIRREEEEEKEEEEEDGEPFLLGPLIAGREKRGGVRVL